MQLQSRWKLEGKKLNYYGMRAKPYTLQNTLRLSRADRAWLARVCSGDDAAPSNAMQRRLLREKIVVDERELRKIPERIEDAAFCTRCCANDYIIPGLELSEAGLCPMCEGEADVRVLESVIPTVEEIAPSPGRLYDAAVFYTGGKDSSFLLWYLSKYKKRRVLALTWEIPYMSESARRSMENARRALPGVSFVRWSMDDRSLATFYDRLFELQNNHCACPSLAYVLFFPMLSALEVPYLVLGNEPAQVRNLYFNNIAPRIAFSYHKSRALETLLNCGRALCLKRPVDFAQYAYLCAVRNLVCRPGLMHKAASRSFGAIGNIRAALGEIDGFQAAMRRAVRRADRAGRMPRLVHIDLGRAAGGTYDWNNVKALLEREVGWEGAREAHKGLHTSCALERVKEHSQFEAFRRMETQTIPFSAVELCCAVSLGSITREAAIEEMKTACGFLAEAPEESACMHRFVKGALGRGV